MKRLLLIAILLIAAPAIAQFGNTVTIVFPGVPSGTCGPLMLGLNSANGDLYSCNVNTWVKVSGAGGAVAWSSLTNAAADLTLANAGFNTTINQTSATNFTLANTTAATVTVPQSSPIINLCGTSWQTGAVSGADCLKMQLVPVAGLNGLVNVALTHTGSTGNFGIQYRNWQDPDSTVRLTWVSDAPVLANGTNTFWTVTGNVFAIDGGQPYCISANAANVNGSPYTCMSRAATNLMTFGTSTVGNRASKILSGNSVFVTGDFTTAANTNLQTITGLSWTFPAVAANWNFHCHLAYSQATGAAAVAFGIQAATNNPTNIFATGLEQITAGPPATFVTGTLATLATTTATNIVSGTPDAQGVNYYVDLNGTLELAASANTVNIMVSTATAGDAVTVKRGSYCSLTP